MNNPYIFGVAVVILIVCLYFVYSAFKDTTNDNSADMTIVITSWAILSAYCSMSFLYLATR
jgi:hypothetical protein